MYIDNMPFDESMRLDTDMIERLLKLTQNGAVASASQITALLNQVMAQFNRSMNQLLFENCLNCFNDYGNFGLIQSNFNPLPLNDFFLFLVSCS